MAEFQYILYNTVNYMGPERSKHCNLCDQDIKPRGWTTHRKSCEMKAAKRQWDQVIVDAIRKEKVSDLSSRLDKPQSAIRIPVPVEMQNHAELLNVDFGYDDPVIGPGPSALNEPEVEAAVPTFNQDDIKIEYHPSSGIEAKLCHCCAVGKEKLTFKNHKDIHNIWEAASHRITKFTKEVISVLFTGDEGPREYDLLPHFTFDAHQLLKFDGNTFVSFVDEPFTARDIWDVQSQLPPGGKPLAYILYADKTKLSSFGTAKGEVKAVKDEKLHSRKPSRVDFKNTVWHKSFARIISLLASKSQTGQWLECLDGVTRWFFLCILILSVDFKEHSLRRPVGYFKIISWANIERVTSNFPRWQNLWHPNHIIGVTFTDSFVHEDISKMIIYATHDVLTKTDSPLGYFLLRCVHLYLEMDMYAALEVHTVNTIKEGRHTVQAFTALMKQYMTQTADDNAKGATCNYNTKLNEQMHGPLKDWYLNRTNFKNVAEQILRIDHWLLVADDMGRHISDFDEYSQRKSDSDGEDDDALDDENTDIGPGADSISTLDPSQHCNPRFFNTLCFDWVFIRTQNGIILGRLVFLFQCTIGNDILSLALIHPFDAPTGPRPQQDKQLNLLRVCAQPRAKAKFFSVQLIIHGALLVQDSGGNPLDYFVVDTINTDMFLCRSKFDLVLILKRSHPRMNSLGNMGPDGKHMAIGMEKERDKEWEKEQHGNDDDDDLNKDRRSIPYLPTLPTPPLLNQKQYHPPDHHHLWGHDCTLALLDPTTLICLHEVVHTRPYSQDRNNIVIVLTVHQPQLQSMIHISLSISQTTIQQPCGGPLPMTRDSELQPDGTMRTDEKQGNLPSIIHWAAAPPLPPLPPSIIITKNDTMSNSSRRADSDTTSNFPEEQQLHMFYYSSLSIYYEFCTTLLRQTVMSHVSWPSTADSSKSDSKWDGQSTADADHISIPGPGASKGELFEMLKMLQVRMQKLQEENRTIKEENKTLHAEKPNVHEETISIYARKYGMMIEMFPKSAFLDKLYHHFPELLHKVMESSYFSDLVMKSIPDARANEIKKLRGVAELKEDRSLKTVFGNWLLLAREHPQILKASLRGITSFHHTSSGGGAHTNSMKWSVQQVMLGCITWAAVLAIFSLSPDTEFSSTGIGKSDQVEDEAHSLDSSVHEDFTNTIDRALAALDMESSDDETETAADVTGPGTPTATALERHVNALASESISQPILSTQRWHTTEAPIVDNVATNNGTAADLEDAAAATPQADEVGAAVISSSGEVLQEAADNLSSTRGRSKKSKRGRKATTPAMATDRTTRQAHK
ncbi:hypothetical protein C8R48DRAFT_668287 [Suillus tomentosus]|nr:hypothetical protein C8R48DRAFT_668287 [Suillus tomentosus]